MPRFFWKQVDLNVDLNSLNFTKIHNYVLFLNEEQKKNLFKINNKINGILNVNSSKVYSKHNLVKSFESRLKINNSNIILIFEGFIVGILTGIVGAGGGFIIIPALVLFAGLSMKTAIGTSLMIIAIKSLFGFIGDLQNDSIIIDWLLLGGFTFLSIIGIFTGLYFNKFIEGNKLKKGFGWFVLIMGIGIILKEII